MCQNSVSHLGNRLLSDEGLVFTFNAWDYVKFSEEDVKFALLLVENQKETCVNDEDRTTYENQSSQFWDFFYSVHQNKFFKNRNWISIEFPELLITNQPLKILEVGCGVGNTIIPLLNNNLNPDLFVYGVDHSSTAIELLNSSTDLDKKRSRVLIYDITDSAEQYPVDFNSLDFCTCIFTLSAIPPQKFRLVLSKIYKLLKPGGKLLFRDYGRFDLSQLRFKRNRYISENYYVRGDGTTTYFFEKELLRAMMIELSFIEEQLELDEKLIVNRKTQQKMHRVWIQGKFVKPHS
ncbi:tRNA N(3)-methylcytidine methyltransferase Mettl2-like [Zophobas morio]|uniref:tRNA N(3)-methylcytidine methyltransferase Mettl2-like n=1 Tax=Zophobas morio TaxID=2755281 RepID=UPI0030836AC2